MRLSSIICMILKWIFYSSVALSHTYYASETETNRKCSGKKLKYLSGDALTDPPNCIGPDGKPYPTAAIAKAYRTSHLWGSSRTGRSLKPIDPYVTQKALLDNYISSNGENIGNFSRKGRNNVNQFSARDSCQGTPARLCKTQYNTSAPMYGVSLTSGQPVTIVQKFPDLLQQVVYESCQSTECDIIRGECTQTYVPALFLVIPLGPVTLTGQDYVLVESGCLCRPKYSTGVSEPSAISAIPHL